MKITLGKLRQIIREGIGGNSDPFHRITVMDSKRPLREANDDDGDAASANTKSKKDPKTSQRSTEGCSLDEQVDRLLTQYEQSANRAPQNESVSMRDLTTRFLLGEAADDGAEDKETSLPADNEPDNNASFDVESFATSVARLIENFDNLIETRTCILKRAEGFLRGAHDDDAVQRFLDSMRDTHGVDETESKFDLELDNQAPPAAGAGPSASA